MKRQIFALGAAGGTRFSGTAEEASRAACASVSSHYLAMALHREFDNHSSGAGEGVMQGIQSDDSLINWAIAGASAGGVFGGYAGDASDQLLELVDRYHIFYSEAPSTWYRLESQQAWLGQTVDLCGSHALEWPDSRRHSGCDNLTRLLQTIAASMMPVEESECRHEMGDCVTRRVQVSTGIVCRHSLSVEISHPFSTVGSRRHEHECLEQLECRLVISGIPPIVREREAPL